MDKSELQQVLNKGLEEKRITDTDYNTALNLFTLIYENHEASESSEAHAKLSSLINQATNYDPSTITTIELEQLITAEKLSLQEFLTANPVLKFSPADLEKMNVTVDTYLFPYDEATRELYKEYYEV